MIDLGRFEALTFDCYGTLIDWESGIVDAVGALAESGGVTPPADAEALELFARLEPEAEAGAFRPYRAVLRDVARGIGAALGCAIDDAAADGFAASVSGWPPFEDAPGALDALGSRYRLGIVSNVDDDLFAGSQALLGVDFDEVVTAQQVESYKPGRAHFDEMLRRLDLKKGRVLHVAQSLYHDVAPAKALGYSCVWVNRRAGQRGGGATPAATATPDLEVPDLRSLAEAAGVLA